MKSHDMTKNMTKDMTTGSPAKLLFFFSLPLMFGNVFQQLYTVVDTMIVGQTLGVSALAALGAAEALNWMSLGSIQGLTQGFSIHMAQKFGAKDEDGLRQTVGHSIVLSAILAVVLTILFQLAVRPVLTVLQTPDDIRPNTILYLRILFSGIPIVIVYNILASMLRAIGDSKTPLMATAVAAISNIVLDLLFVCVFGWAIAGAAAATLIAQGISVVYCLNIIKKLSLLHPRRKDLHLTFELSSKLIFLGFPMAFQNFIIAIGSMIVQRLINSYGVIFIAGFTATNKLYGVLEIAATSYGFAMVTYTGQNLGAKEPQRIKKGLKAGLLIALATSAALGAALLLLGKPLLLLFISGTEQEISQTLAIAYHYLSIMSICLPILYILHVVRSTLQGLGDTLSPLLSGVAEFIMRTGCVLLLPIWLGAEGIFYAEVLAWSGADLVLIPSCIWALRHRLGQEKGKQLETPEK